MKDSDNTEGRPTPPDPRPGPPDDEPRVESSPEAIESDLLRILVTDPRFRWAAILALLMAGSVILAVVPIFVVSTPEIDPPFRASLLDKFQARALIRTAREAGAAGRLPESITAWKTALANDLASLEARRGALEVLTGSTAWTQDDVRFGYA